MPAILHIFHRLKSARETAQGIKEVHKMFLRKYSLEKRALSVSFPLHLVFEFSNPRSDLSLSRDFFVPIINGSKVHQELFYPPWGRYSRLGHFVLRITLSQSKDWNSILGHVLDLGSLGSLFMILSRNSLSGISVHSYSLISREGIREGKNGC